MVRWLAVAVGAVTALGLSLALAAVAQQLQLPDAPLVKYGAEALALALAGFATGHLAGRWHALNAAWAASFYILAQAAIITFREASEARALGISGLPPIDFWSLAASDVVALVAATLGGLLVARWSPSPEIPEPHD